VKIERPSKGLLGADLLAGFTFAVANIPTAMAHALMATVNPVLGIYTLMFAVPVGAIFTSSVFMNVSTSSALSMATGSSLIDYSGDAKVQALATLVLLVGLIQLVAGLLKAGSLLRFVPHSVMVGFINGVAVLIILGQMSDLTGYESTYSNKVFQTLDMMLHRQEIYLVPIGLQRWR
jgi:SulP family sulfate permease